MACSFLRPMDPILKEVIADVMLSNKVRLNMKLGQQMLNELPFYHFDPENLHEQQDEYENEDQDASE